MIAVASIIDNVFPLLDKTLLMSPSHLAAANIANKANPTSAIINPLKPNIQCSPDTTPKYGGNIKFPAPKNMANKANPTTTVSTLCFFIKTPCINFIGNI